MSEQLNERRQQAVQDIGPQLKELVDFWGYDTVYYVMLYLSGDVQVNRQLVEAVQPTSSPKETP